MIRERMLKQKKKLLLAAVLVAAAAAGITLAWLIVSAQRVNVFEAGETEIVIDEDFEIPPILKPGDEIVKSPKVTNTGNLSCFVRMRADFSTSEALKFCEDLDIDVSSWDTSRVGIDGYYYYMEILEPGDTTKPLFEKVVIRNTFDDGQDTPITETDLKDFDIYIYAEAVQDGEHAELPAGEHPDKEYLDIWKNYTGGGSSD